MNKFNALQGSIVAVSLFALSACGSRADEETASPPTEAAPVETTAATTEEPAADVDFASLTGDAAAGKTVFAVCMSCHSRDEGVNNVGPSLYNIVDRQAGTIEGFNYSDANKNSGITWTEEELFVYLKDPQAKIPGTKMVFPGLPDPQKRADLIAFLKS
ncbi:c-type cytochrome [Qipengyuania qiaonensis]|uniref:Cytochrome c family protein n=1 Tax=Qipengyuania qiaonensis TaxID=2867240 RepID=A0ABS7JBV8_9SPHN|nr:cytochrome c family protein [Qipengyuania qiaonensis]MBX7483544.1 cytochrome c family protein [Qipengyuania qiaonensis]